MLLKCGEKEGKLIRKFVFRPIDRFSVRECGRAQVLNTAQKGSGDIVARQKPS